MDPPSKITDYLYLGSEWNAGNKKEMDKVGITHILNISTESPNYFPNDITYYTIRVKDTDSVQIHKYFQDAYNFISITIFY